MHTGTWHVEVYLYEQDGTTRAEAVLRTDAGTELRHEGTARRNPGDRDIPEIGDELAACRALSGLAHDLLDATIADVQANDPAPGRPHIAADID
jgi:Rv2632c-like